MCAPQAKTTILKALKFLASRAPLRFHLVLKYENSPFNKQTGPPRVVHNTWKCIFSWSLRLFVDLLCHWWHTKSFIALSLFFLLDQDPSFCGQEAISLLYEYHPKLPQNPCFWENYLFGVKKWYLPKNKSCSKHL